MTLVRGTLCRSTRAIVLPGGIVRRGTPGTLVSLRENLGRELFTVTFDGGQKLIVFAHDSARIEGEIRDAQTDALRAERVDRHRRDAPALETWAEVDRMFEHWAERACARLEGRTGPH